MATRKRTPICHELKCWPEEFKEMLSGWKCADFRKADRDFQEGDRIRMREFDPVYGSYTGSEFSCWITHVLGGGKFGIPEGYCVLSITYD